MHLPLWKPPNARRPVFGLVVGLTAAGSHLGGGCATPGPRPTAAPTVHANDNPRGARVEDHSAIRFPRAVLYKPRDPMEGGLAYTLAPLIVLEAPRAVAGAKGMPVFGALGSSQSDQVHVDAMRPTVYFESSQVLVRGKPYDAMTYRWHLAFDTPGGKSIRERGLRILLDEDGFPILAETASLEPATDATFTRRNLFLFASFERAAEEAHGDALPGRRFAAEADPKVAPGARVLRVLEDGPVPMGPYVYLDAATGRPVTLHCRCSPSQIDEVVETVEYDLAPFDRVRAVHAGWMQDARSREADPLSALLDRPLDAALRWPE